MLVQLREGGRARPYDLSELRYALLGVMSRVAVDLLEWLLAAELGFHGKRGVILKHDDARQLLACSQRRAGDAMRELTELGLVRQRPHFRLRTAEERAPHTAKRWELTPAYQTTARCREIIGRKVGRLARRDVVGRKSQPGESHLNLRLRSIGVRARRPEQAFAADVLRARVPAPLPVEVAVVIERQPDGSVRFGSELSADALAQKLRTAGDRTVLRNLDEDSTASAWRSFEESLARREGGGGEAS